MSNETAQISGKDVRKIVRAARLIDQILSTLPPELTKLGFDSESGRHAVEARWARHRARSTVEPCEPESA
jgi:hypothetical protein